ncbi:MAG: hypothetical protein JSU70_03800 [Phycisphaerales bacterium]|nr:MAG: hypothetical protein JSU70_03800 [Phycisphaerales bacterium]
MAHNLLEAGYLLMVHNRTKAKASTLLDEGAAWAPNPAQVALDSDVAITCVTDTPDARRVLGLFQFDLLIKTGWPQNTSFVCWVS